MSKRIKKPENPRMSNWDIIMRAAERCGFIAQSYGGTSILMCHEEQKKHGIFDKIQKMCNH